MGSLLQLRHIISIIVAVRVSVLVCIGFSVVWGIKICLISLMKRQILVQWWCTWAIFRGLPRFPLHMQMGGDLKCERHTNMSLACEQNVASCSSCKKIHGIFECHCRQSGQLNDGKPVRIQPENRGGQKLGMITLSQSLSVLPESLCVTMEVSFWVVINNHPFIILLMVIVIVVGNSLARIFESKQDPAFKKWKDMMDKEEAIRSRTILSVA